MVINFKSTLHALLKLIRLPFGVKYYLRFWINFLHFAAASTELLHHLPPYQRQELLASVSCDLPTAAGGRGRFTNV